MVVLEGREERGRMTRLCVDTGGLVEKGARVRPQGRGGVIMYFTQIISYHCIDVVL